MPITLTSRQWRLYDYLKELGDQWITQREIARYFNTNFPNVYTQFTQDEAVFHDSITRMEIGLDIRHLNESYEIQKIILTNANGVKIANEEEYREYSLSRWKSLKGMIKRLAWKDHKAKLNGQMKLVFGDSMARDYYETFVNEYEKEIK